MPVVLHTITGHELPATDHAIENTASLGAANGILYGLNVSAVDNNIIVGNGYGMICGRLFEIQTETLAVVLPSSIRQGQVILTLDLSLEDPLTISYDLTGAPLTQSADAVFTDGIYQMQLCTFTASSSDVSDPVITCQTLKGIGLVTSGNYIKPNRTVAQNLGYLDAAMKNQFTGSGITSDLTPICTGFVTNSKKNIEFMVPMAKPLSSSAGTVKVHGCYATIRQNGVYIWGDASAQKAIDPAELTVYRTGGGVRVKWAHGAVINAKATNNDVCIIDIQIRLNVS